MTTTTPTLVDVGPLIAELDERIARAESVRADIARRFGGGCEHSASGRIAETHRKHPGLDLLRSFRQQLIDLVEAS